MNNCPARFWKPYFDKLNNLVGIIKKSDNLHKNLQGLGGVKV